jgi:hypothetical protein
MKGGQCMKGGQNKMMGGQNKMMGGQNKMMGGKRSRKGTPWTAFVKKIYAQLKKKNPNASLGDAMKAASKRKSEM